MDEQPSPPPSHRRNDTHDDTGTADRAASRSVAVQTLDSEVTDRHLPVEGNIPRWVDGTLLRTGPAKFEVGDRSLRHWFDGFAMLHRFAITNGSVRYSNKYLETSSYTHATDHNELAYGEFATDPCRDLWERFFSVFSTDSTDNANVNIARHADRFTALTETPIPVEFDPDTLETLGVVDDNADFGDMSSAHPHRDDGVTFNYVTSFSRTSEYKLYRVRDDGDTHDVFATLSRKHPAYLHSFGLTPSYLVLVEFPFVVNPRDFLLRNRPFIENYQWDPDRGTQFTLVDRTTGNVTAEFTTDAFFAFHHVNAYEADDTVVVDIVAYDDASIIEDFYLDTITAPDFSPEPARLVRFRLADAITSEVIYSGPIELPRINYDRANTSQYQYVYGVGNRENPPRDLPNTLLKVDVTSGTATVWDEPGTYPGEPVFVEAPAATTEDDGVILSVVLNPDTHQSFLLVLDASSFVELARASVSHHIPIGFHGNFYQ